jgi:nitrite reductase (NADH) large subunit
VHKNAFSKPFLALSVLIAALLASALLNGAWQYAQSVADIHIIEQIWRDGLFRQITGFTLLGLSAFAALLGLRKRITRFALGNYQVWRTIHLVLGLLIVAALLVHTGFRMGSGSNFLLMVTFMAILVVGAGAGIFLSRSEANPKPARRSQTNFGIWLHIITLWPFPALLIVHILKAYYY